MPRLDLWMPCYQAASTLRAALRSLQRQTFEDWRLLLVDDGSTDRSAEIAESFAEPRFTVLRTPHEGIVAALLAAARASEAPLVARMDADDVAHPRRLEMQLASRADVVATRVRTLGPSAEGMRRYLRWQNALVTHDEIVRELFVESPIAHPTVLMKRSLYERAGGYRDVDGPEDYDLWLRMWEAGARFEKVPRVLLSWRDAPGRLSRTHAAYSDKAFHRVKLAHVVRHSILKRGPVAVWGAGPIGRRWMRDLRARGVEVACAIDIDPKKIGRRVAGGVEIVSPEAALAGRPRILGAVGSRGARGLIRARLLEAGLSEGGDFLFLA